LRSLLKPIERDCHLPRGNAPAFANRSKQKSLQGAIPAGFLFHRQRPFSGQRSSGKLHHAVPTAHATASWLVFSQFADHRVGGQPQASDLLANLLAVQP
jgi:hypothetical protein